MKITKFAAEKFTKLAEIAAKSAAGTASLNSSCQPKEPKNIRECLAKKK